MTSLAEQLRRLAIPQALQQREIKKKVSLLFNEHEAGNLDRDTFYDIGLDGLKELISLDRRFAEFSDNLYHVNSRLFERTTQAKDANKKLDQTVKKFLQLLSPYVLLKPAHKALEWLISRYHIQDFNTNDLMALVLPYHETKFFAKVLQLINLHLPSSQHFSWLETIQKEGVHLPKLILINHIISDTSFLRFICNIFMNTVKEHENSKAVEKLVTVINFYCLTLVNMLSRKEVNDQHVTVILPSLIFALKNEALSVKAAAYMICGQLVALHQVSQLLLDEIINQIINDIGENKKELQKERVLLLIIVFQKQNAAKLPVSCKTNFASMKEILLKLAEDGVHTEPLIENLKKIGLAKDFMDEDEKKIKVASSSGPQVAVDLHYFQELKECQGDKKESVWLKLRPCIIDKVDNYDVFKALCKYAPSYDKLVLLLCLDKILQKTSIQKQRLVVNKILKSNFGNTNPYLLEISNGLQNDKNLQDIVVSFVTNQNKEYDNPVEFEPWLAAMNELKSVRYFADNYAIWELGLRILIASLPTEYNPTPALQILQFLKSLKRKKVKIRFDILNAVIEYVNSGGVEPCEWYDLSSKNPENWLKVHILEYILEEVYKEPSIEVKCGPIMEKFTKMAFINGESYVDFLGAVCAGTPFQSPGSPEYSISPAFQIYCLNTIWLLLKSNEKSLSNEVFSTPDHALCYILICLSNSLAPVRKATFEVIEVLKTLLGKNGEGYHFYQQLTQRSHEIMSDSEQLSVTLYYLLSPSKSVQAILDPDIVPALTETRNNLFKTISSMLTPLYVTAKILSILETVNSQKIVMGLVNVCVKSISVSKESSVARVVLHNFWSRINEETAVVLENPEVWDLAVKCVKHPKCEDLNPAVSFLKAITKEVFDKLSTERKSQLLQLLISTRSETDCNEISSAVASAVKRINIDANIILPLIKKMSDSSSLQNEKRERTTSARVTESADWKTGISLLELIQSKKKLQNTKLLLKPLFGVLQFCFMQEEQTNFEYAKQLALGCLLHCCQKLTAESQHVDESSINADLVVQCLRASPNPQTHHHALLLLSCIASIVPDQVIHNIMAIFTFMGSSVTRLDDEHSVKIVTQVVDAVVPVLMKSMNKRNQNTEKVMAKLLIVFVWALKDIPQHRRKPLFLQLLTTLQPDRSLWILLLLLIENYVQQGNLARTEGLPPNLFLGLQLTLSLTPQVIVGTVLKIVKYLNSLPPEHLNKEGGLGMMRMTPSKPENLFETEIKNSKQLRQFVYTILTFLNNLLSNNNFIMQITEENKDENSLEPVFRDTIAFLMKYIQTAKHQYEFEHDKFWKAVIHQCYEMLDKFVSLVPTEMLLTVIKNLLHHSMGVLRKKALDLMNVLLQNRKDDFNQSEKNSLTGLLKSILRIILEIGENAEQETEILQQTALISLKLLTKILSSENLPLFKEILAQLCDIAKNKKCQGHLLGSVMIAISDQVTCLKVHSMSQLPVFLPLMLEMFSDNVSEEKVSDLGLICVATALYRVVDVLPHFLSPYLDKILYNVCVASVLAPENSDLSKKLVQIRQKIASNVESRVLIPSVATCYEALIGSNKFDATGPLLLTLSTNYSASPDVVVLVADLTKFFFNALNFRTSADASAVILDDVEKVEGFVIEALVQLVLKLSESSFRPLYYQLCHWASEHRDRNISFFRLSCRLAESLKGLFVLFAGHFLHNAASLLDSVNVTKAESSYFGDDKDSESKSILLLENILKTLHLVFLYDLGDTSNFLNKDKFEVLLHPLVDQLENTLGGMDVMEERRTKLLTPCLAQMALATDDTLWKSLNYQILVKTKSNLPQVRIGALQTIVAMAAKLGEDYLTLLPETIGSLAELLEDEDEKVEDAMKKAIQQLEEVLGQPIREYFQQ